MKKVKYLIVTVFTFMLTFPVLACEKGDTKACQNVIAACIPEKLPNTVHMVVVALQIAVPVLLVIFGMIDLIKAIVAGKEDEIKKAQGVFVRRLITGALVFFVFAITKFLVYFAADNEQQSTNIVKCVDCFINNKCEKVDKDAKKTS